MIASKQSPEGGAGEPGRHKPRCERETGGEDLGGARQNIQARLESRSRELEAKAATLAERCRASEAALRESEERCRLLAQAVTGVIYDWNLPAGEIRHSEGLHALVGVHAEEAPLDPGWWMRRIHPEDVPGVERVSCELLEGAAGQLALEYRVRHEDGRWIHVWDQGRIIRDQAGRPVRLVGIAADITARKQAETALRESEARLKDFLATASDWFWETRADHRFTFVSPGATDAGLDPHWMLGRTRWETVGADPATDPLWRAYHAELEAHRPFRDFAYTYVRPDGRELHLEVSGTPVFAEDGTLQGYRGTVRDVTERKQVAAALAASEERLRLALEAAELGTWDVDLATGTVTWDRRCRTIFDIDHEAPLPVEEAMTLVHDDDREAARGVYEQAIAPDATGGYAAEKRIVRPDGSVRWIVAKGRVDFAGEGAARQAVRIRGIAVDVTERKQAEQALHRAKEAAERANAAKSRFLAAASHDLRQPLQAFDLQRAILVQRVSDPETLRTLQELGLSIDVMRNTLDALLDLGQLETGPIKAEIGEFGLDKLFQRIMGEFRGVAAAKGLALKAVPSTAVVRSDPRLLERIVQNLVANAIKYTWTGKVLLGGRRRGERLRIEVWDTGIGIAPDQLEAIFEEFYQVANVARERRFGCGLGLSIARAAAELLGHRLDVRSIPGKGSVFAVEVPFVGRTQAKPAPRLDRVPSTTPVSWVTILLVEDDAAIRSSLRTLLELEGYRVAAAASGGEALGLVEQGICRPAMVIADQNLPGGLSGVETVQRLRGLSNPRLPALVITGDVLPDRLAAIQLAALPCLTKPVGADELRVLVRSLVGRRPHVATMPADLPPQTPSPEQGRAAVVPAAQPTVFVVEDDPTEARLLQGLLAAAGRHAEIYASAEAFLRAYHPGIEGCLVADIHLPGMSGLELQQELARRGGGPPCVFVTGRGELAQVIQAMREGAVDFLVKPIGGEALLASVVRALEHARHRIRAGVPSAEAAARLGRLTLREREIVDLVAAGLPNKEVAFRLRISLRTVEGHRARAMHKLGVRTLAELVRLLLASNPSRQQQQHGR